MTANTAEQGQGGRELPPFSPDATCPKCGHDVVTVAYVGTHRSWESPQCGATINDWKYTEHLDRCCQRCHYVWAEAALAALREREGADGGR